MRVQLVNPSDVSFGIAVITPRWLYVLAAATPARFGDPTLTDETLERFDPESVSAGDVVGIGIHTSNALRGYDVGREARSRGAFVVFGGIHASLYPDEARDRGGAHAVVTGDGEVVWPEVLADCESGAPRATYEGGWLPGESMLPGRWDLVPQGRYMWASVQTLRGCPKHCSFCSVWRTDGQKPRARTADAVVEEIVDLRRRGFRFIALADDNFYPVTFKDLAAARRRGDQALFGQLEAQRAAQFDLLSRLAKLPRGTIFFTQITVEAAEDPAFLDAMREAHIVGALVGLESVTAEGLHSIFKDFNPSGEALTASLRTFQRHGVHVLGSFIFGLPTDTAETFDATARLAEESGITFAQFVMLTPFPGTVDFDRWEKSLAPAPPTVNGTPVTRHWLIPSISRPKIYTPHPSMSADEIRARAQRVWDRFYSLPLVWARSRCTPTLKSRLAFVLISKLYRQMYGTTGITTDSGRRASATRWARWIAKPCRLLFAGRPMPELQVPTA